MDTLGPHTVLADRFQLEAELGRGAFGSTWRAHDRRTDGKVAVKVLWPSRLTSAGDLERLDREARGLQRLDHPGIPRYVHHEVLPSSEDGPPVFLLAQGLCPGRTVASAIASGERFDPVRVVDLLRRLMEILCHLEQQDPPVVHRDIKPDNLLLDTDGALHLVDFGAVREAVQDTFHRGNTVVGTWGYMPPEQLVGQAVHASDLYAAGMVALHALTRRPPETLMDGMRVDVDALHLSVSPGLRRVLAGLVAPLVEQRYTSAADVLADLERVADGKPPRRAPEPPAVRAERKAQRRRIAWRLTALFAVLVALPIGLLLAMRAGNAPSFLGGWSSILYILPLLWTGGAILSFGEDSGKDLLDPSDDLLSAVGVGIGRLFAWTGRADDHAVPLRWITADSRQTIAQVTLEPRTLRPTHLSFRPHGHSRAMTFELQDDPRAQALYARKKARILYPLDSPGAWSVSAYCVTRPLIGVPEDDPELPTVLVTDGRARIEAARHAAAPGPRELASARPREVRR